jgi:tetratricopeptide (TPR) repeat protein
MAYFQNGSDCEEAVKACEKGLERAPESMIVHFMAATVFSACGRKKEARKTAKELLRINPKFSVESFATRLPQKYQARAGPVLRANFPNAIPRISFRVLPIPGRSSPDEPRSRAHNADPRMHTH